MPHSATGRVGGQHVPLADGEMTAPQVFARLVYCGSSTPTRLKLGVVDEAGQVPLPRQGAHVSAAVSDSSSELYSQVKLVGADRK